MTTSHPVDSTTRHCCGAIGGHAPECENGHPYYQGGEGLRELRQDVRTLMTEVSLVDLLPSELFGLIDALGGARVRIAAAGMERLPVDLDGPRSS